MSTARKILSNTLAQVISKACMALLGLVVVKITTAYLSVEGYGEYVLVYEFLAFFGIAADLGLYTIAVREMSRDEKRIPEIIGNVLSLRLILVVLTMSLAILAAFLIPKYADTRIPLGVAIASLTVILTILNGTVTSVLQTKLQMHYASITVVVGRIISVLAMLGIAFSGVPKDSDQGFYLLIAAGIIGNIFMLIGTSYFVRKITPLSLRFDFHIWREVFWSALPYGIALILSTIYFRIDSIFLSLMRGSAEVGIYGVAMKMLESITIIPLYFMNSVLPVLTRSLENKDGKHQTIIARAFDFLAALSFPIVVGGFILAYPIVFIVSTPDFLSRLSEGFYGSDIALQILIFALLFQFLNVLFSFILIAIGQQYKLLYVNLIGVIFNICSNLLIIPTYGFRGAAFTSVLSEGIILLGAFILARKALAFRLHLGNLFKIIFAALLMGAVIHYLQPFTYTYLQNWSVLLLIPLGAFVYGSTLFATGAVNKDMLKMLKKGEEVC